MGCPVPAASARLTVTDQIFTRLGRSPLSPPTMPTEQHDLATCLQAHADRFAPIPFCPPLHRVSLLGHPVTPWKAGSARHLAKVATVSDRVPAGSVCLHGRTACLQVCAAQRADMRANRRAGPHHVRRVYIHGRVLRGVPVPSMTSRTGHLDHPDVLSDISLYCRCAAFSASAQQSARLIQQPVQPRGNGAAWSPGAAKRRLAWLLMRCCSSAVRAPDIWLHAAAPLCLA